MLREWGQAFFLASVGLAAGEPFFNSFLNGSGFFYVALGLPITIIPLAIVGILARTRYCMNFHSIAGLLAGCSTNTSLLGFASSLSDKGIALISYSTVYPFSYVPKNYLGTSASNALMDCVTKKHGTDTQRFPVYTYFSFF